MSVESGDFVINCRDNIIVGTSFAARSYEISKHRPPECGPWLYAKGFLRVPLRDYQEAAQHPLLSEIAEKHKSLISEDIERLHPKYYLYSLYRPSLLHPSGKIAVSQGRFLAKATHTLAKLLLSSIDATNRIDLSNVTD